MTYMETNTVPFTYLTEEQVDFLYENDDPGLFVFITDGDEGLVRNFEDRIYSFKEVLEEVVYNESIVFNEEPEKIEGFEKKLNRYGDWKLTKVVD